MASPYLPVPWSSAGVSKMCQISHPRATSQGQGTMLGRALLKHPGLNFPMKTKPFVQSAQNSHQTCPLPRTISPGYGKSLPPSPVSFIEMGPSDHVATPRVFPNHTPQGSYLNAYFNDREPPQGTSLEDSGSYPWHVSSRCHLRHLLVPALLLGR